MKYEDNSTFEEEINAKAILVEAIEKFYQEHKKKFKDEKTLTKKINKRTEEIYLRSKTKEAIQKEKSLFLDTLFRSRIDNIIMHQILPRDLHLTLCDGFNKILCMEEKDHELFSPSDLFTRKEEFLQLIKEKYEDENKSPAKFFSDLASFLKNEEHDNETYLQDNETKTKQLELTTSLKKQKKEIGLATKKHLKKIFKKDFYKEKNNFPFSELKTCIGKGLREPYNYDSQLLIQFAKANFTLDKKRRFSIKEDITMEKLHFFCDKSVDKSLLLVRMAARNDKIQKSPKLKTFGQIPKPVIQLILENVDGKSWEERIKKKDNKKKNIGNERGFVG